MGFCIAFPVICSENKLPCASFFEKIPYHPKHFIIIILNVFIATGRYHHDQLLQK